MMLPFVGSLLSGGVLALLILQLGPIRAGFMAAVAAGILLLLEQWLGGPLAMVFVFGVAIWGSVALFATLLRLWRSVTLTLQVSVFVAVGLLVSFYAVGDIVEFGRSLVDLLSKQLADEGYFDLSQLFAENREELALGLPSVIAYLAWIMGVVSMLGGYAMYRTLYDNEAVFGRFCDINYGRVLAIAMSLVALAAWLTSVMFVQDLAMLMFTTFWLHGLAMVHWLYAADKAPGAVLFATYVGMVFLMPLVTISLAIAGYIDAWFDLRKRAITTD